MKTANEIISQSKRIFAYYRNTPQYPAKLHTTAEIGRRYLHNIAQHYGKRYGSETWQKIGNNPLPASIYAK